MVSVHPLALYIKLKAPVEVGKKLTEATPFVVEPKFAPAGFPGWALHVPFVGEPVNVVPVPAHIV
jgi:hypothetical protein